MKYYILSFIFLIHVCSSCNKDERIFIPDETFLINQDVFLSKLVAHPESFQITLGNAPFLFKGAGDIVIEIPEGALLDEYGAVVQGAVKLEYQEFSTVKSNLLFSPSTEFRNKVYNCHKMVFLSFNRNGKLLKKVKPIYIYLPETESGLKNGYYKMEGNKDSSGRIIWTNDSQSTNLLDIRDWKINHLESTINIKGFRLECNPEAQWYAIGSFSEMDSVENVTVCVELPTGFDHHNSLVYWVAKDENIVLKLDWNEQSANINCKGNLTFPKLINGNFIVISDFGNDNYFFGTTNAVIESRTNASIKPKRKSINEIKEAFKSL